MIEYVFRPIRTRKGKRVQSALYSGRYSLGRGERSVTVPLHVTDKKAAVAKLRALVVQREQEAAGLVVAPSLREAAARPVAELVEAYRVALIGLGRDRFHVQGTANRLSRMVREIGWGRLADVRPDTFVAWLSGLGRAAKTRKEYQTSANAWLNWLVKTEQATRNPLAKLDKVETRGKQVRETRSLSREEIDRLLAVAGERRPLYLFMLYTGLRKGEVEALRWSDLHDLGGSRPYVLVRVETAKGKKKRPVPLHPVLAAELRTMRERWVARCVAVGHQVDSGARVFGYFLPRAAVLRRDLAKAGISYRDGTGRVLHFHALRKTFQTLGVVAGVNQRSAQALLGHSDPSLTAEVYTDVAALELHGEVAKLPALGVAADAQGVAENAQNRDFRGVLAELIQMAQVVLDKEKAPSDEGAKDGGRHRTRTCDPIRVKDVL